MRSGAESASSTWRTSVESVLSSDLAARRAVEELVTECAHVHAATALEHAGGHVGSALIAHQADAVSAHVNLSGDIVDGDGSEGELEPGVGDLAVHEFGIAVDGSAGA